jgi:DNA-binding MarR family transcriptional regulator
MTSTLQKLEQKGFIALAPDPADGRGKRVRLTPEGLATRNRAIAALGPTTQELESALGSAGFQAAMPFLVELRTYLDAARDGEDQAAAEVRDTGS